MKRKYRKDYNESKEQCIQYAKEHLDIIHYREIMSSFSRMAVYNMIMFVIVMLFLLIAFAYVVLVKIDFSGGPYEFLLAGGKAVLAMIIIGIIAAIISGVISNIIDHTAGKKWFQYYMTWYDAFHK